MLLTHALALSANQFLCKKKSLRVCVLGENWTREVHFSTCRYKDNIPSNRGRRLMTWSLCIINRLITMSYSWWNTFCVGGVAKWHRLRGVTCDIWRVCTRFVCCWLSPTLGKLFVSRYWLPITSSFWSTRNPRTPHTERGSGGGIICWPYEWKQKLLLTLQVP